MKKLARHTKSNYRGLVSFPILYKKVNFVWNIDEKFASMMGDSRGSQDPARSLIQQNHQGISFKFKI